MASSKSAVIAALIANGLIAVTKFIGYLLTGSPSMLSETYHSISDTGNQVLLLTGIRYGDSEITEHHPFGRGKSEFFYSFLVSVFLFGIAGFQSAKHGYNAVRDALAEGAGHSGETADVIIQGVNLTQLVPVESFWVNIVVLVAAFVFEAAALYKANKGIQRIQEENGYDGIVETFRETSDVTTLTVFTEDTVALLGIVLALFGIIATRYLENPIFDAATSLIIGIMLMFVAVALAWENKRLLLGESLSDSENKRLREITEGYDEINSVVDIRTIYFGPSTILVFVDAEFADETTTTEIEEVVADVEPKMKEFDSDIKRVYIEPTDSDSN